MPTGSAGYQPGQRNRTIFKHVRVVPGEFSGDVLNSELNSAELPRVAAFQPLDHVQHQIVEDLCPGASSRHGRRQQLTP